MLASGLIGRLILDSDSEYATFQQIAAFLDDGEAAAAAVAKERGYELIIDERKAHSVLSRQVPLRWSLELVQHWIRLEGFDAATTTEILTRIRLRASYAPHRLHPLREWWMRFGPDA